MKRNDAIPLLTACLAFTLASSHVFGAEEHRSASATAQTVTTRRATLPDTSQMNLLCIIIEDCYAGVWGSYGNSICRTPNMDRFARTAVQFDRAYVQAVACNPSRTSFLTGLRPLSSRVWSNPQVMSERLPPGTRTLPVLLKQRGFHTAVIGKFFHFHSSDQLMSFDRIEHYQPPPGWHGEAPLAKFRPPRRAKSDQYGDSGKEVEEEEDFLQAQTAVTLLQEFARTKQRFFLSVNQERPHTPLIVPKKYIDMYDPAQIPDPPAPPLSLQGFPYSKRASGGNPDIFIRGQPTPRQAREAIAAYYACVSFVDDNVGRILAALDRQGLADNTVVFILGDHGFHLGDHGFWSKYSMLESTRRAPLWVRVPGAPANGKVCREFVEFVDFVPTLGELFGLNMAPNLEGISFAPLLANPSKPWKSAVFMVQNPDEQVVRNQRYSYFELKNNPVPAALYDLETDPWETTNLAENWAYAKIRMEMAALLHSGWKSVLPNSNP